MSDLIADMSARLFRDHRPAAGGAAEFDAALWAGIEENGLPLALVPEDLGGFGLDPAEALAILTAAGETAAPGPLADTMLGQWLLARAGQDPVQGPLVISADGAPAPWGRVAAAVLVIRGGSMALWQGPCDWAPGLSLAEEPMDRYLGGGRLLWSGDVTFDPALIRALRAVLMVAQMAGAAAGALELTLRHVQDRQQFGRPLAAFQAVQHNVAVIAAEVATMRAASAMAALAIPAVTRDPQGFQLRAAAAKIRASEAAGRVAALCHQVHGAIGVTREYDLQMLTRRLWAWRDLHGTDHAWADWLGGELAASGPDRFWPELTRNPGEPA